MKEIATQLSSKRQCGCEVRRCLCDVVGVLRRAGEMDELGGVLELGLGVKLLLHEIPAELNEKKKCERRLEKAASVTRWLSRRDW
jgi:hypothetical protein